MLTRTRLLPWSLALLFQGWGSAASPERIVLPIDSSLVSKATLTHAKGEMVKTGAGEALQVIFGHGVAYPNIRFEASTAGFDPDWSAYTAFGVTVENATAGRVRVQLRVDSPRDSQRGRQGGAELEAGEKRRLVLSLPGRAITGMRGQPPVRGCQALDLPLAASPVDLDTTKILRFQVYSARPERDIRLLIHRFELFGEAAAGAGAFVDRFGQFNGADWPGKLHGEAEFGARIEREARSLADHPELPARDRWGGWAEGPTLTATGRFHPAEYDGKWWLVDPDGKLFWSSGITCVNFRQTTRTRGREGCFEWLPPEGDPLRPFLTHSGKPHAEMNFFQANLCRKYGPDYAAQYIDRCLQRFRSWGVNTVANWSDYDAVALRKAVPYTIPVSSKSRMFLARETPKAGLVKKKWFPDVFDPQFGPNLEAALLRDAGPHRDDPWLLGVFVDNELDWVGGDPFKNPAGALRISAVAFQNDASFAIKRALVEAVQAKFPSPDAFNQVLGTGFRAWDELLAPVAFTPAQMKQGAALFAELDERIAEQYFRTVSGAMKKVLPGVLYLGSRFSNYSDEVLRQAAKYCQVVSFNIYTELPEDRLADELATRYHFPVIIGEFHFGALDRGMFDPGLRKAENQAERAAKYAAYLEQAAKGAWCVGAHWFQYVDQPLTGRADGENYNIGFVSVTDDPYPEMVAAARKINGELYRIRAGKE